tara:strand:- start:984 stop:1682 length:699 start_codon:yes stop_codon:yes gene_type:complete
MKKPIIGITLDSEKKKTYSKFPWYALRENYLTSLTQFNAIPFPLLHEKKYISDFCNFIDGLIITGGDFDIDPKIYNAKNTKSKNIKNKRTNFEIKIFNNFLKYNKPILGICGGAQLINVACGGTLFQDLKNKPIKHEQLNPRNQTSHNVNLIKKTKLYKICGVKQLKVNSAHHQSIRKIGKNLNISCRANDGVIEGVEHQKHKWCIGLQWHPEFLITKYDKKIIKNFIDESK